MFQESRFMLLLGRLYRYWARFKQDVRHPGSIDLPPRNPYRLPAAQMPGQCCKNHRARSAFIPPFPPAPHFAPLRRAAMV